MKRPGAFHSSEGSGESHTAWKWLETPAWGSRVGYNLYGSSYSMSGNQIQSTVPRPVYGKYMQQHRNKISQQVNNESGL